MSVSYGCSNKLLQTWWLKTEKIDCHISGGLESEMVSLD